MFTQFFNDLFLNISSGVSLAASSGDGVLITFGGSIGLIVIIAGVLLSMSRTKIKATKADNYVKSSIKLTAKNDQYTHTTTSKVRVSK